MTKREIITEIIKSGADVTECDLRAVDACIVDYNGLHVGIASRLTERRKKAGLAHELGHIKRGGLYQINTPPLLRQKSECLADRYAANCIATPQEIKKALADGCNSVWELADLFDVPCDVMADIVQSYKCRGEV